MVPAKVPANRIAARFTLAATALLLAALVGTHIPGETKAGFSGSTFTVNSRGDESDSNPGDGVCATATGVTCTLRGAIEEANASPGRDTIAFNLPGRNRRIAPTSGFPATTDPVVIDGTTQRGYHKKPLIEIDGSSAGFANGLLLNGSDSVVKGLTINSFDGVGIGVGSHRNVIQGNFIGTDGSGRIDRGNRDGGLVVSGDQNLIGGASRSAGNVISGNDEFGVVLGPGENRLHGNMIGTDVRGRKAIGNSFGGVQACGCDPGGSLPGLPEIGGLEAGAGNVISGNGGNGIVGEGIIRAFGNRIGTDVSGKKALGNRAVGIAVHSFLWGAYLEARGNIIAHNGAEGINADSGLALGNSIFSNEGVGLVLDSNFASPSLETATQHRGNLRVVGSAVVFPDAVVDFEVFSNNRCDPSGFGEGERTLGSITASADGQGNVRLTFGLAAHRAKFVTATLTTNVDGRLRTMNFSNCVSVLVN